MYTIHELVPAPWGDDYRLVDSFEIREDAEKVLQVLESVNVSFKVYKIVSWDESVVAGEELFEKGLVKEDLRRPLLSLTKVEWELLKDMGMLWELYPESPSTWAELQSQKHEPFE